MKKVGGSGLADIDVGESECKRFEGDYEKTLELFDLGLETAGIPKEECEQSNTE